MQSASLQWFAGRVLFWILIGGVVLTSALGGCSRCAPGKKASLTEESRKDPACEKEIQGALQALRKHLGMGAQMTKGDVESVLSHDEVVKSYARDGVRYTMTISLRKDDGACKLMVVKREKQEPGKTSTSWGNYGAVKLTVCHCK